MKRLMSKKTLDLPTVTGLRKYPVQVEKVAEGRLGFGRGSRAGQHCFLWPGLLQPQPPIAHGSGETCQTSPAVRAKRQSPELQEQARQQTAGVWDQKDTEAPPNLPVQPEVSSLPGVRLVLRAFYHWNVVYQD